MRTHSVFDECESLRNVTLSSIHSLIGEARDMGTLCSDTSVIVAGEGGRPGGVTSFIEL